MRIVSFHRTALSRQTAEAVRIRRRGGEGAVLNSKAEFNRCYLPRLKLVGEQETLEMEQAEEQAEAEVREILREDDHQWETQKSRLRSSSKKGKTTIPGNRNSGKRSSKEQDGQERQSKRRKYALIKDGWGTKTTVLNARNTTFLEQVEEEQVEAEWWREQDGLGATVEPSNSMVEEHTMKGDQPAQTVPQYSNHCDQALVSTQEMGSRGDEQHSAGNDEKEHLEGTEIITIEENNSGEGNNVVVQNRDQRESRWSLGIDIFCPVSTGLGLDIHQISRSR